MRPLALRLREYRSWAELDLALPEGCVALIGQNGAGKSSVVNAIDWALFGGRDLARQRARGAHPDEPTVVELTFEHAGQLYRARRTVGARTALDFERWEGDGSPD